MRNLLNSQSIIKKKAIAFLGLLLYMILIIVYILYLIARRLGIRIKILRFFEKFLYKLTQKLESKKGKGVSRTELIDLAFSNIMAKRRRSFVTIGGMAIGIAMIVLLVSIGYGLQALVTNRVARLEELRQTEVSILPGSNIFINDEVLSYFRTIEKVEKVLPQIGLVGKVNYNNSLTDMAVYGVTKAYLEESAISPTIGRIFESNELITDIEARKEDLEETLFDDEVILNDDTIVVEGESDLAPSMFVSRIAFPDEFKDKEAVVNKSFLTVLGIKESEAVGELFSVVFVSLNKFSDKSQNKIESSPVEYEIVGVTPDDSTPFFFVPFIHLRVLGITNYSEAKVIVEKEGDLEEVRMSIEGGGYSTSSVVDTIAEIDGFFSTARVALLILGSIALLVASLGMFNTLTVSLLERTREVGLLRAMGMKSSEVRDLFFAESMIMGSLGGFVGIFLGLIVGKLLELGLSIYAMISGVGSIRIIDMPWLFVLFIILVSYFVGILTGIYPARRAMKISALDSLRYE